MKVNNFKKLLSITKISLFLVILVLGLNPLFSQAGKEEIISNQTYPKIANYFLSWSLLDKSVLELAKWNILILDMENQVNNPEKLRKIRELNPNVVILAYVPIEEIVYDNVNCQFTQLRKKIADYSPESWYLHNNKRERISFWPGAEVMNITNSAPLKEGQRWNTFLPYFVKNEILATGLWDGIFYDNTSHSISWVKPGKIDINNDGRADSDFYVDAQWKAGTMKMLRSTREANPNYIIIGNSASDIDFQKYLNGRMFETFPTPWEGNGDWGYVTDLYLNRFPLKSLDPQVYVINSNTENTGVMDNYRKMRFGLTSTLLGKGYYSFDFGDRSHTQTWWYDEYSSFLGDSQSEAYNLLDSDDQNIEVGLWRRDFARGIVIVNSTNQEQVYVFRGEDFEKINGKQDRRVNNGSKINWLRIAPEDGVVLLKTNKDIIGSNYLNGNFVRIFNMDGHQERNGFFTFQEEYQGNMEILKTDLNGDGKLEVLANGEGKIFIYKEGQETKSFYPYTENFKKHISFAVADLDNDGNQEIITGAGPGGGPHVRVFNKEGELINQFFAYESDFYGGISITAGDLNEDGLKEIITSPGQGGNSQVKIFTQYGHLLNNFFAYDYQTSVSTRVVSNDINHDGVDEILVSIDNF